MVRKSSKSRARSNAKKTTVNRSVTTEDAKQIEAFLQDFDKQARVNRAAIISAGDNFKLMIENGVSIQLTSLSLSIRKMTVAEYINKGNSFDASEREGIDDIINNIVGSLGTNECVRKNASSKSRKQRRSASKTGRKNPQTPFSVTENVSTQKIQRSSSRVRGSSMKTPLTNKHFNFSTPAVTPKFEYRKGMTPNTSRRAVPGEVLMSMAGSPVVINEAKNNRSNKTSSLVDINDTTVEQSNDKKVCVTPKMDVIKNELLNMDSPTSRNNAIMKLQEKLANMLVLKGSQ